VYFAGKSVYNPVMESVSLESALACGVSDLAFPVVAENGHIAVRHYKVGRIITQCARTEYLFLTQANICMCWVAPEHVDCVLAKKGGCCGQKRPGIFNYANASSARRWTRKGGR